MSALATLELALAAHILHAEPAIEAQIVGTVRVPVETRLGIYRNAYVFRIVEALDTDFSGLHALIGDDEWLVLTRAYIATHPSTHFSLRMFGRHFSAFLRAAAPWREHALLAEMAEFEWAVAHAFDAADSPLVQIADMGRIPAEAWADMRLTLHASAMRLDLRWNAPAIWKAVKAGETPPDPERATEPVAWLIWRKGLNSYFRSLGRDEAAALDAAGAGRSFAELCEGLCEWTAPDEAPARAAALLKRWIEDEMVAGIVLP